MNYVVLTLVLVFGLASALPHTRSHQLRTRRNTPVNGKVGIFDGTSTTIDKHPYMVGILVYDYFFCAGTILSSNIVITLADCVKNLAASDVTVVSGSSDGTTGTNYSVKKIIPHPSSGTAELDYDFALLKIKGSFKWGDKVGNVSLPTAEVKVKTPLTVAGWGDTSAVNADGTLMQGTMKAWSTKSCNSTYASYDVTWTDRMNCAYNKGKTTMCDNDYGDAFVKNNVIYGMFSAAGSSGFCDTSAIPVILSDIYSVVDWINKYI